MRLSKWMSNIDPNMIIMIMLIINIIGIPTAVGLAAEGASWDRSYAVAEGTFIYVDIYYITGSGQESLICHITEHGVNTSFIGRPYLSSLHLVIYIYFNNNQSKYTMTIVKNSEMTMLFGDVILTIYSQYYKEGFHMLIFFNIIGILIIIDLSLIIIYVRIGNQYEDSTKT